MVTDVVLWVAALLVGGLLVALVQTIVATGRREVPPVSEEECRRWLADYLRSMQWPTACSPSASTFVFTHRRRSTTATETAEERLRREQRQWRASAENVRRRRRARRPPDDEHSKEPA